MKGDLTDVRHFISEELYNNYINKINELIEEPEKREFYAKNSRKYFEQEFLIQNRIQSLEQIYTNKGIK